LLHGVAVADGDGAVVEGAERLESRGLLAVLDADEGGTTDSSRAYATL